MSAKRAGRFTLFLLLLTPIATLSQSSLPPSKNVRAAYDRFRDETRVIASALDLRVVKGDVANASVSIGVIYPGNEFAQPLAKVSFLITTRSTSWRYLQVRNLVVLADDRRIFMGELERADSEPMLGGVQETVAWKPTLEMLRIIANAKKVEMALNYDELVLPDTSQYAIRDLLSRLK